jgi:HSP20 family protein
MTRRDLEAWMWAEACEQLARAERLHRQFFRLGEAGARPLWEPPVDIFESERELCILAALPGVDPAQVEISVENGILSIAGDRPAPPLQRDAAIHRLEIPQGRFERRIALPAGRFELAKRMLADGCLTLVLRKLK